MAARGALLTSPLKAKRHEDWTASCPCCHAGDGRAPWAEPDLSSGPVDQGGGDLNGLWALLFLLPRGAARPVAARKGTGQPRPSKGLAPTHAAQSGGCPDNPGSSQVLPPQNRARSQSPRPALSLVKPPPPPCWVFGRGSDGGVWMGTELQCSLAPLGTTYSVGVCYCRGRGRHSRILGPTAFAAAPSELSLSPFSDLPCTFTLLAPPG